MKRLRKIRIERNLTQSDIAEKIGVSTNTYSRYERGERNPNPEILEKISRCLDISVDYIIGNIDTPLTLSQFNFNKELDDLSYEEIFKKYELLFDEKPLNKEIAIKILDLIRDLTTK